MKGRVGRVLGRKDVERKIEAYNKKLKEYSEMTLEELHAIFNNPDKSKRPGGVYRLALLQVTEDKIHLEKVGKLKAAMAEEAEKPKEPNKEEDGGL